MENFRLKKLISNQKVKEAIALLLVSAVLILITYVLCAAVLR